MDIVQISRTERNLDLPCVVQAFQAEYRFNAQYDLVSCPDTAHRLIEYYSIDDLLTTCGESPNTKGFHVCPGGWQSWAPGWELPPNTSYPEYRSFLIPVLSKYTECPEVWRGKNEVTGHFISYLRWQASEEGKDLYLVLASTGLNTAPVSYHINYKERTIAIDVYANGKTWQHGELVAEITFFTCRGYFALKDCISALYRNDRFADLSFLDVDGVLAAQQTVAADKAAKKRKFMPGGWESWYDHYNKIDEKLLLDDLAYLGKTNNLIKLTYLDKGRRIVFQIDDGWQKALGDWEINENRFPHGLRFVTNKIVERGYIPGLWIAPFIVDARSEVYSKHPNWILKNEHGKPVEAGFNFAWGEAPRYIYYCLDISRVDVIQYLDEVIGRAINEWGFRYLKLDFLYAGTLWGAFSNGGAAYEHYLRSIKILTARKIDKNGKPVAYLGCGMPFELSYRALPLSRIGADTKENWDRADLKFLRYNGRPSAYISMKDTVSHAFWDQSVFINDPDVVFLRNRHTGLNNTEKETIALVNYIFASQLMLSDDPVTFNAATDAELTTKIAKLYDRLDAEEFGCRQITTDVFYLFTRSGAYSGLLNLSSKKIPLHMARTLSGESWFTDTAPRYEVVSAGLHTASKKIQFKEHSITLFKKLTNGERENRGNE